MSLPELEATPVTEFEFRSLPDGTLVSDADVALPVLERIAGWGDDELGRPYAAVAVRRDDRTWAVGLTRLKAEAIELPKLDAVSLEVAVPPDGDRVILVDGEEPVGRLASPLAAAVAELERRGRDSFQAFVVRADRLDDGRWELTVDPL